MKEKSYRRIEAIRKGNEILKHLGQAKEPARGQEIAAAIGLPTGTVMCYLVTHEDSGFVQRVGDHWRIGTGLALIWARAKSNLEGEKMLIESQIKELDSPIIVLRGDRLNQGDGMTNTLDSGTMAGMTNIKEEKTYGK